MNFLLKSYHQLSNDELYSILQLRNEVFVVEQTCAYLDLDGKDQKAFHLMGFENLKLIAYARLLPPGISYNECSIGRVLVAADHRHNNLGKALMQHAITNCLEEFKTSVIVISAQQYLEKFYTALGFATESDAYLEDDIPHIQMRYTKPTRHVA